MTARAIPFPKKNLESSAIKSAAYDSKNRILQVWFVSGGIWDYAGVSPQKYRAFVTATSQGAYFNEKIRPLYASRKVK